MKKVFLFVCLLCMGLGVYAQQQDSTLYVYCTIGGIFKVNRTMQVQFDCGEGFAKADKQEFTGMAAAMNFYAAQGWQFVAAYTEPGTVATWHYWIVRKRQ